MNALINLKDCRKYMTITINNKDHQIKLAGTIDDPYFCGQDVGIVLGYVDVKKILQKFVDSDEKKSLKELNDELGYATYPNSLLGKYHKIFYIATTDQYAKERLFKIGSTERLMSRIAPYNTGRPKEDDYYYVWAMKCYNCKELDQHIQKLLTTFKYSKDAVGPTSTNKQEMYHGIKFTDFVVIVTFIIENYDKSIDFINTFIKNRLDTSMEEEDTIPERLNLRQLTFKIGEHTEVIDLEKEEEVIIKEELTILLEALSERRKNKDEEIIVMRNDIVDHLASKVVLDRTSLWNRVKTVVSWKDGKTNVKHGEVLCKIKYK
jgi:hypothetical protein